jgi:hypothetical protein
MVSGLCLWEKMRCLYEVFIKQSFVLHKRPGNENEIPGRLISEFERGLYKNHSSYAGMHFEDVYILALF